MKRKPLKIRGLFLWAVQIETCKLWVTTRRESMEQAVAKARKVIAKEYTGEKITSVNAHGTLDA
jgi:hypothetical protein